MGRQSGGGASGGRYGDTISIGGGCVGVWGGLRGGVRGWREWEKLDSDTVWILQYPKRLEQSTRVSAMGDEPVQPGPGRPPVNETDGWSIHLRVGWLHHHCYRCAKPTPWWVGVILPQQTVVFSRGDSDFFPQSHQLSSGYGVA